MSSGSVRMHVPLDLHQHEDPPESAADREAAPESCDCEDGGALPPPVAGRLWREDGRVLFQDASGAGPVAVRLVWARPLSGRDGPVSILLAGKKKEVAFLSSLDELGPESRSVALEELAAGTILPVITEIYEVKPRFGNYYWDVETNMGRKKFLLSAPENNNYRPRPDVIVVKDVSGNLYEIASVSGLSRMSRYEMDRVL